MTNQELKNMVASLSVAQAKTDKQMDKTINTLEKLGIFAKNTNKHLDGMTKTIGEEVEDFFYNSVKRKMQLGGVDFDYIDNNIRSSLKGKHHEMDIFLENGNSVGIVEVKHKVKKDSIDQLKIIVDSFYKFHPNFKSYKIIPAMAGKVFPKQLQDYALDQGFVVLTQKGDYIEQRMPV
jgi:hypothetical protein